MCYNIYCMSTNYEKLTGVAVPLGALYTKENQIIGEFADLIPFAEFCKKVSIKLIQLLPVNDSGTQSSPYSALSAYALHPIYIRLKDIEEFDEIYKTDEKFKKEYDLFLKDNKYANRYDYDSILNSKINFLQKIFEQTEIYKNGKANKALEKFIKDNPWVKTYSVYKRLKWNYMQASWKTWLESERYITSEKITELWNQKAFKKEHLFYVWCQFIADTQFKNAVKVVSSLGILLKGDIPILMNEDSCDAWSLPQFFNQTLRAGSPADGENPTGQNWGFPTYNWKNLKEDNYSWWVNRLKNAEQYYDAYRLDHILGFFRIWAIPDVDSNALTGHTEPYSPIKIEELYNLGFDNDRIRWLSEPHIPTGQIQNITNDYDSACKLLEQICTRIGNEELWLFNKKINGSQKIWDFKFTKFSNKEVLNKVKEKLVEYWSNRSLIKIANNKYLPMWTYGQSTSWGSLNENERSGLSNLIQKNSEKNIKLWQKNAEQILKNLTESVKMIPCGEDLGVGIPCVPSVMKKHNILGLRVVRWCRYWDKENQPYVDFDDYEPLSVVTTSVHDSSTIREWYEKEYQPLIKINELENKKVESAKIKKEEDDDEVDIFSLSKEKEAFSPEIVYKIMKSCSKSASIWYIPPIQDFLYLNKKYWLENCQDERINIPGTVTKFNWTYRMPVSIETLSEDEATIEKIREICNRE